MSDIHFDRKNHWEKIYESKALHECSWYQPTPQTSLELIFEYAPGKSASIIDIGGGDSLLVDHLLDQGYNNVSVLDISENAVERARKRLGNKASNVKWITADVASFTPTSQYEIWHDRAAFHFLKDASDIENYITAASNSIPRGGILILGSFSEKGPEKCSGLNITQYSEPKLTQLFSKSFEKISCKYSDHTTPSGGQQSFIFCSFKRI